ncbi:hypothetical protein [Streptomyces europaeiscabiei]|uniref:hypothetical protein n=1 Tax=Streptomyces europaeiscabiei TaxID=146819 RepID=UPI0029B453E4|nr:hypothetical protein [Streptomyces europaeiscabiei]MDX3839369.1 hypothetical protein [Streptomyces europaeiscabiei]
MPVAEGRAGAVVWLSVLSTVPGECALSGAGVAPVPLGWAFARWTLTAAEPVEPVAVPPGLETASGEAADVSPRPVIALWTPVRASPVLEGAPPIEPTAALAKPVAVTPGPCGVVSRPRTAGLVPGGVADGMVGVVGAPAGSAAVRLGPVAARWTFTASPEGLVEARPELPTVLPEPEPEPEVLVVPGGVLVGLAGAAAGFTAVRWTAAAGLPGAVPRGARALGAGRPWPVVVPGAVPAVLPSPATGRRASSAAVFVLVGVPSGPPDVP